MNHEPRPRQHLIAAAKLYPGAWRTFDEFRADRGKDLPDWPEWCFAPMATSYAIVSKGNGRLTPAIVGDVGRLAALAAWRTTQGIYRFDPELYAALINTPLTAELPVEVLFRLPEWCVYIETPGMTWGNATLHGFFAHLESDANTGHVELRLLIDCSDALLPIPLHVGKWSLAEAARRAITEGLVQGKSVGLPIDASVDAEIVEVTSPLVSLLLYLCADDPEIGDGTRRPAMPVPTKTKEGMRIFPPNSPSTWDVGVRLGAALRRARETDEVSPHESVSAGQRGRPRAHIRRAHWHTYRVGTGRTERRIKWLPPVPVNVDDLDALPAVVHRAK